MKSLLTLFVLLFSSSVFAGCISGDCVNGYGTFTFASGNKYVGEFKYGDYNGQGTFTFANGNKHVGSYSNNMRNGLGTFTYADGEIIKGIWENDEHVEPN